MITKVIKTFHKDTQISKALCAQIHNDTKTDNSAAREQWGWNPKWDLDRMTQDMLKVIKEKHEKGLI